MKRILQFSLFIGILFSSFISIAAWSEKTFNFDGKERHYWIYLPPSYTASKPASVVVTLHGMGDNATNFKNIGFNNIADTANIIVLVPDALVDGLTGMTAWNSQAGIAGVYFPNSDIDDIGFINAMIDSTQAQYAVNPAKVYVCGFSMGGFMTQKLALLSNEKFAAFASIAGTIGSGIEIPSTVRPLPIAHFHGTTDATVGYDSNTFGSNVKVLIDYWVANNECDTSPIHTALPDTKADGYTVDHYEYKGGKNGTVVELFKINNSDHMWLGMENDIAYIVELWRFFSRFNKPLDIDEISPAYENISIVPNPAQNEISLGISYQIGKHYSLNVMDIQGRILLKQNIYQAETKVDVSLIPNGVYFLNINREGNTVSRKIVINR